MVGDHGIKEQKGLYTKGQDHFFLGKHVMASSWPFYWDISNRGIFATVEGKKAVGAGICITCVDY